MRRSTSMDRSSLWLTFPPRYRHSFVWLYTWPAANVAVDSGIPFARKHMISVLASDTGGQTPRTRPRSPPSSSSAARAISRRPRHRQRKACPKATSPGLTLRQLLPSAPPPPRPLFFFRCTKAYMMPSSALKGVEATFNNRREEDVE